MNMNLRKWAVVGAVAAILLAAMALAGCSSNKGTSETPAAASQSAPSAEAPSAEAGHEMTPGMMMPASTIPEIWTQIGEEQGKLSAAIQNGQLKDVHHLAFGVRDLVIALADKAKTAVPASAMKLDGMVAQVKASADQLDELGDAGNLSGTQAEYAKLETVLGALKAVTGTK